ncbi:MAG TPA: protein kinase [Thermoanaerobaculia bacterium]|nr:protein kinase [Thermoanaerobaculia bacterium]
MSDIDRSSVIAPGTRIGPYEVVSLLGEGGMGEVYRGRDPRLGRDVAIKVLTHDSARDSDATARFEREARAVASLSHPNILAIFDLGHHEGTRYVVTELLEGETLRERIHDTPMNWRKSVEIGAEIAEGLAAAHSRSVVHRDLKPENIFLTHDGRVKILDFGLAQVDPFLVSGDQANLPTTRFKTGPGTVIGTLGYMAPEQLRGESVEPSADIFSLGCLLFEMVTARKPFLRSSGAATIAAILKEDIPRDSLSDVVPLELQRIIEGCVEKVPVDRFQSARDLALTLRAIGSSSSVISGLLNDVERRPAKKSKSIDSIAVLPFQNVGNDPETEYLSEGITEGIINRLSQLPKLKVMARSTVFRYKNREGDAQAVGRELRVRAVVTGRLQHVGSRLVINVELVDAIDGAQLWGERYNRELADLMQLQDEMSREVAEKLRLKLTGAEKKRLRKRSTENTAAYQLYLRGRHQWNKRNEEALHKSIAFFREAIDADPSFASAYAGMADSYITLGTNIPLPPREAMPRAKAAARRAVELDPTLAEAWASLAAVKWWYDWDWDGAEADYHRAIALNPNYAAVHDSFGMLLCARGRYDAASEQFAKAASLDPLSLIVTVHAGWPHYFARQYDVALAQFEKALELDDHFVPAHGWRGMALSQQGRHNEALKAFERGLAVDRVPILMAMLGHAHAVAGHRKEAEEALAALTAESKSRYISPYDLALIHAALGDTDRTIAALHEALEDHSAWMVFLNIDPRLDSMRGVPEFEELAKKLR